jgi:RHS repeat-associated protein
MKISYLHASKQNTCVSDIYACNNKGMVYQETVVATVSTKTLDFIASPEGRAIPKAKINPADVATTGDQMKFEYSLKDHLGNLRISCRCGEPKRDAQGVIIPTGQLGAGIDAVAVVQEQHYDAWGLAFSSATQPPTSEILKDKFTYNGKELLTDLDLGWNDYGARMFDATIGRWSAVDRFAEKYISQTQYNYAGNNPILNIDINGDSLDVANNEQSLTDINSLVSSDNQQFIIYTGSGEFLNVSLNFGDLPIEMIATIIGNDAGLALIGQVSGAKENILYEASEIGLFKYENGDPRGVIMSNDNNGIVNASNGGLDGLGTHSFRPASKYDGHLVIPLSGSYEEGDYSKTSLINKSLSSIVFHELAENYENSK